MSELDDLGIEAAQPNLFEEVVVHFLPNGQPEKELDTIVSESRCRVLFVADIHTDHRIREALSYPVAQRLRAMGFTHYCIEAPGKVQPILDEIQPGKPVVDIIVNPQIGPKSDKDRSFADAVIAMSGTGMRIVAIDDDRNYSNEPISFEEREETMYSRLSGVLNEPNSRALVLVGLNHTGQEAIAPPDVPSLASRVVENKIPALTVRFAGPLLRGSRPLPGFLTKLDPDT
jgi:hypothetical protein